MRRKLTTFLIAAALVASVAAFAQGTAGGGATSAAVPVASPSKVGIINIQQAILATNEGRREFEVLNTKFKPKQDELEKGGKDLDAMRQQLSTQGDKMNEEARATLVKQIDAKQRALQRSADDAQTDFNAQQQEIAQRILQKLAPVVDKFAKQNGYALLIDDSNPWPQGQVLWATDSVDVTKAVVDQFNAQSGVAAPTASAPSSTRPAPATRPATGAPAAGTAAPRPTSPKPPQP